MSDPAKNRTLVLRLKAASSTIELRSQKKYYLLFRFRKKEDKVFMCFVTNIVLFFYFIVPDDGFEPPTYCL
jgi:hypothetical protein